MFNLVIFATLLLFSNVVSSQYMVGSFVNDHVIVEIEYCVDIGCIDMLASKLSTGSSAFIEPTIKSQCRIIHSHQTIRPIKISTSYFDNNYIMIAETFVCDNFYSCTKYICDQSRTNPYYFFIVDINEI